MKVRIAHCGIADLIVKSSAVNSRSIHPLSSGAAIMRECALEIDIGDNEIVVLDTNGCDAHVRIANHGDKALLVQIAKRGAEGSQGAEAISPLSFGQRIARQYREFHVKGTLVLRCRGARDKDGILLRETA